MTVIYQVLACNLDSSGEDGSTIVHATYGLCPVGENVYQERDAAEKVAHAHRLKLIAQFIEFPERYFSRYAHIHYTVKDAFWAAFGFADGDRNKAGLFRYLRGLRERGTSLNLEKELSQGQATALCDMFCHDVIDVVALNVL